MQVQSAERAKRTHKGRVYMARRSGKNCQGEPGGTGEGGGGPTWAAAPQYYGSRRHGAPQRQELSERATGGGRGRASEEGDLVVNIMAGVPAHAHAHAHGIQRWLAQAQADWRWLAVRRFGGLAMLTS